MAAASEDGEQQVYWRSSLLPHGKRKEAAVIVSSFQVAAATTSLQPDVATSFM
ncbi:hypothetical protein ACP70R_008478 [Stipagrostis hirtigluma subsp. patula]